MGVADDLVETVDTAAERLLRFDDADASVRPAANAWSPKEIVGHLVDSAANNHQRFVRAQQEGSLTFPGYAQEHWVRSQGYQASDWADLVRFWQLFNHHLAQVIRRIPAAALAVDCRVGDGEPVTLGFLVADYLVHLQHHLEQIDAQLVRP